MRWQVAVLATAIGLAGCGTTQSFLPDTGVQGQAMSPMAAEAYLSHGLGANLAGAPTIVDDEYSSQALTSALPSEVDLRSECSPIADQGRLGSCTAFAIVKGLREFYLEKEGQYQPLSPSFLWWEERSEEGATNQDTGATVAMGMSVLAQDGVCPETDDPYYTDAQQQLPETELDQVISTPPSQQAVADAQQFTLGPAKPVRTLSEVQHELAAGYPVVMGIQVYSSFKQATVGGMVPMPDTSTEQLLGGHAVMAVGYDQSRQVLIMRNSWGPTWGDHGYFYLPYDYMRDGLAKDGWTVEE